MFRTHVIYLWLQLIGAFILLLIIAAVAAPLLDAAVTVPMVAALFFLLALLAVGVAIAGALPMLLLLQYLLMAAGTRAGRPGDFDAFRRWLLCYCLVPAFLPALAFGLPSVRQAAGLAVALLAAWVVATVSVFWYNARRLHHEWEAGVPR
ncbi:hypothetical protein [Hymenobacter sp. BT559]|uniref:hypothetical protein n=1 Tax=Hymenobacter sp. BT559 TaxID=2795729 RepID=UPI0018EAA6DC|nr:hypothetical protein [Hymenobacter sp. BT559]MBJ6142104.1 hypothetical protein [Hymenobacter sp. BT559]